MANAYGFNPDRSKAPVYTKEEINQMDLANDQDLQNEIAARQALDTRVSTIIADELAPHRELLWNGKATGNSPLMDQGDHCTLSKAPSGYDELEVLIGLGNAVDRKIGYYRIPVTGGEVWITTSQGDSSYVSIGPIEFVLSVSGATLTLSTKTHVYEQMNGSTSFVGGTSADAFAVLEVYGIRASKVADSEIIDIRTGHDGTVYASSGDAVRHAELSPIILAPYVTHDNCYKKYDQTDYTASNNFECKVYEIPPYVKKLHVTTTAYYYPPVVLTVVAPDDVTSNPAAFVNSQIHYPENGDVSITNYDLTCNVNSYKWLYVNRYKGANVPQIVVEAYLDNLFDNSYSLLDGKTHDDINDVMSILPTKYLVTGNLIDFSQCTEGKYLGQNGQEITGAAYGITNYIYVHGIDTLYRSPARTVADSVIFYDVNKHANGKSSFVTDSVSIDVPSDAYYMRMNYGLAAALEQKVFLTADQNFLTKYGYLEHGRYLDEQRIVTPNVTAQPLDKIMHDGGMSCVFHSLGTIGDSLNTGALCYYDPSTQTQKTISYPEWSWPQRWAAETDNTAYNFSIGGLTTRTWLARFLGANPDDPSFQQNPCIAYTIALGVNDMSANPTGGHVDLGTPSSVGSGDDTYYANYQLIIDAIKSIQPRAKIFVMTNPKVGAETSGYNDAVRWMANNNSSVYLVDLYAYGFSLFANMINNENLWYGNHCTCLGYQMVSWWIGTYLDWIVRNNESEFRDTALVGTDYTMPDLD